MKVIRIAAIFAALPIVSAHASVIPGDQLLVFPSSPIGAAPLAAESPSYESTFDISIEFDGGLTSSQMEAFTQAEDFWETVILGYKEEVNDIFVGPTITARGEYIDGVNGTLGQAGPRTAYFKTDNLYTSTGEMVFDSADLDNMESDGSLASVILHEMGHVLGFGTLWNYPGYYDGNYTYGSGQYTGAYGLAAYQAECDASATYVPVELDGGTGTANAHWDETWACGPNSLMTGYLDTPVTFSLATLGVFEDMGYNTILTAATTAVPLPGGMAMAMTGVTALVGLRRRRRAA